MKIKQHVVITDPNKLMKGNLNCFNLFESECRHMTGWIDCGLVEIDVTVDMSLVLAEATDDINAKIGAAAALLQTLENEKAELLALPAPEDEYEDTVYNNDESEDDIADRENKILDSQERR